MRTTALALVLLLAVAGLGGCLAAPLALGAAGGVATFQYLENQDVREYEAPFDAVADATLAAMQELAYPVKGFSKREATEATLKVDDASVGLAQFPEGTVRVAVRVGTFDTADHRRRAALIHEAIAKRVPTVAP